jgi:hypothetical protein
VSAERETVKIGLQTQGLKETLRAFKQLDKDASKEAREKSQEIANKMAGYIRSSLGRAGDVRVDNLAVSVKSGRDRVPVIRIGGRATPRVSGGGGPGQLVIGMEFGADQSGPNAWRFPPRTPRKGRGNEGYWIFPEAKRRQREIVKLWFDAMDGVIKKWSD